MVCVSGIKSVPGLVSTIGYYGGYFKTYGYMFNSVIHMISVYTVVLVTLQRYIAVCQPHQAKKWANIKTARYEVIGITLFSCLFYLPVRPFQRSVYWNEAKNRYDARFTDFGSTFSFKVGYMVIAYYILIYIIPLSILVFTTYQLIKSLKRLRDRKAEMTGAGGAGGGKKDEVTLSLITVVIVFTVCQLTNPVRHNIAFVCVFLWLFTKKMDQHFWCHFALVTQAF